MKFEEVRLILEKRSYKHREGYTGNKKGSYIEKGKTKWDYSSDEAKPGNERIVTQIQNKIKKKFGKDVSREKIKSALKDSQSLFDTFKERADKKIGTDQNDPRWRGYVFGCFTSAMANKLKG